MPKTNRDLELRIVAKNLASKTIQEVQNSLKKFAGSATGITGGLKGSFSALSTGFKGVFSGLKNVGSAFLSAFSGMGRIIKSIIDSVFSLTGALVGLLGIYGGLQAVKAFVQLNAEFEKMQVTMDVLTKGKGEEWFNALNQWALNMPVSMQEVSKAFITMQAYGLKPSIKLMENLVNVASVLPESGRAIVGIARAMGQIQSKTRLEGQELRQLAEWAVPGYEAVYTKIFKKISQETGKSTSELKFTMIDSQTALKALMETIEEHFGGAAKRISETTSGLFIRLTNYFKEFVREIGSAGAMGPFRDILENMVEWVKEAFQSGEMQKIANIIGSSLSIAFNGILDMFKSISSGAINWGDIFLYILEGLVASVMVFINTLSGIKLIALVVKEAWVLFAIAFNAILYGMSWAIEQVISKARDLANLLPSWIPGVESLQSAFESLAGVSEGFTQNFADNITTLSPMITTTKDQMVATADAITNRYNKSNETIIKLIDNFEKLKTTPAMPPPLPTVGGGVEFAAPAPKPLIMTEEEVRKHKKAINAMRKENIGWLIDNGNFWTKLRWSLTLYLEDLEKNKLKRAAAIFKEFFSILERGFQNTISSIVDGTANMNETVHNILKTIRDAFVNMVSQMVFEWIKGKTLMLAKEIFFQEATTTAVAIGETERLAIEKASMLKSIAITIAGVIKKIMAYAYQAAAAVFNAFAFIPFVGPILGAAAVAGALALIIGFAKKVASFEKGTGLMGVKETGPAILHRGEIVLNKKESDAYRAGRSEGSGTTSDINLSFSIQALDGADIERVVRKKIIPIIQKNIRDRGKGRTMIREAF